MSQEDPRSLDEQLERLAARLSAIGWSEVRSSPRTRELLAHIVDGLAADGEILQESGYYTIEQAYTKICDLLQQGTIPWIKTFNHCGQDHPYHALQTYVRCPICKEYRAKARGLLAHDEIEDVATLVVHWLRIDPRTIPGWNSACD